jgi:magnesium-transporting ATPase (P-type)
VFKGNKVVWIAALSLVLLQVAFTLLPFINSWFGSAPIGVAKWAASIGLAVAVFFVIEIGKKVQRSRTHP